MQITDTTVSPYYIHSPDCTYSHFNACSVCPICKKTLGPNDFCELVIADPPPNAVGEDTTKNAFQKLFTKHSPHSSYLNHQEMSARLLKILDDERRIVKFLLKQCVVSNSWAVLRTGSVGRAYEELKKEHTKLRQATNSERIQTEQTIAGLQHRLQAVTGSYQEAQKKMEEKDKQLDQFRSFCREDAARLLPPGSAHSNASSREYQQQQALSRHQRRPLTNGSAGSNHSMGSGGGGGAPPPPPPPMHAFAENKKRQEQAKQANLDQMMRGRRTNIVMGGHQPSPQSQQSQQSQQHSYGGSGMHNVHPTPIVPPPNSGGGGGGSHHPSRRGGGGGSQYNSLPPPGSSPRIRDLAPGSGYNFTSRKRPRTATSSNHGYASSSYGSSRGGGGFGRR